MIIFFRLYYAYYPSIWFCILVGWRIGHVAQNLHSFQHRSPGLSSSDLEPRIPRVQWPSPRLVSPRRTCVEMYLGCGKFPSWLNLGGWATPKIPESQSWVAKSLTERIPQSFVKPNCSIGESDGDRIPPNCRLKEGPQTTYICSSLPIHEFLYWKKFRITTKLFQELPCDLEIWHLVVEQQNYQPTSTQK